MKRRAATSNPTDSLSLWSVLLLMGGLPVVMLTIMVDQVSPLITGISTYDTGTFGNPFAEVKLGYLLIMTVMIAGALVYRSLQPSFTLEPSVTHGPLLVLLAVVLLSQLLSPFPTVAIAGIYELREGTVTWICYLALAFAVTHMAWPRGRYENLAYALMPFLAVNLLLGLLAFFGVNVLNVAAVKAFIYGGAVTDVPAGHLLYTTLGNPNYASGFGAVCAALLLTLAVLTGDRTKRIWFLIGGWAAFTVVIATLSMSGFVALVAALPVMVLLIWRYAEGRRTLLAGAAALLGCVVIYLGLLRYQPQVWDETVGFFVAAVKSGPTEPVVVPPSSESGELPVFPPSGWSFGTGRSYYWQHTLELIKERPLVGYGLDTLAYTFPQFRADKAASLNDSGHMVNKPHNLYLGIAYGAGIPALLAFLALVAVVLWRHARAVWRRLELDPVHVALLPGIAAYLVQGLVNDSHIGYSAVFWIFLGAASNMLRTAEARAAAPQARPKKAG